MAIEIIEQFFIRCHIVNALVALDRVVEVDKAQQADLTILPILKRLLLMPHLHYCSYYTFGFSIGLWPIDSRELLTNTQFATGLHESMMADTLELFAVVRIGILDGVRALIGHLAKKELGTILGLVREDASVEFP